MIIDVLLQSNVGKKLSCIQTQNHVPKKGCEAYFSTFIFYFMTLLSVCRIMLKLVQCEHCAWGLDFFYLSATERAVRAWQNGVYLIAIGQP